MSKQTHYHQVLPDHVRLVRWVKRWWHYCENEWNRQYYADVHSAEERTRQERAMDELVRVSEELGLYDDPTAA